MHVAVHINICYESIAILLMMDIVFWKQKLKINTL